MCFKYKIATEKRFEKHRILQHQLTDFSDIENIMRIHSYVFIMCKKIDLALQKHINALLKSHNKEQDLICPAIGKVFSLSINSKIYCFRLDGQYTMLDICESLIQIFSEIDSEGIEFMIGIYNHEKVYRAGEYWNISELFDSLYDRKEKLFTIEGEMFLDDFKSQISFTIHVQNGEITLYADKQAEEKFVDFYNLYYKKDCNRDKIFSFVYDFDLSADFEITNVTPLIAEDSKDENIVLEQGIDYLKLHFIKDRLVIVFNTDIPDRVLTVDTFKKILKQSVSNSIGYARIDTIFSYREYDYNEFVMSKLLFGNKVEAGTYTYSVYATTKSDDIFWTDIDNRTFVDEFDYFLELLQKENYEQINENSYQSLVYKDFYCLGAKNFCSYLVYRY